MYKKLPSKKGGKSPPLSNERLGVKKCGPHGVSKLDKGRAVYWTREGVPYTIGMTSMFICFYIFAPNNDVSHLFFIII
jgi:hypothetical protein